MLYPFGHRRRLGGAATLSSVALVAVAVAVWGFGLFFAAGERPYAGPASPSPAFAASVPSLDETIRIHFLDVGQGDAVLIESPAGRRVLYDGGESQARLLSALERVNTTSLEMVFASHAHADHIGGLTAALSAFPPRFFMDNGIPHTTQTYGRVMSAVLASRAQLLEPEARTLNLDGMSLHVVPPPGDPRMGHNDNSLGLVVEFGEFRAFLGGDAEGHQWAWWLENHADLLSPVHVHKASHHGSRNGDTAEGMARLRPAVVVIGVGAGNTYGHPHPEALRLYADVGAQVFRTDHHGTVTVVGDASGAFDLEVERDAPAGPPLDSLADESTCVDLNRADEETLQELPGIGPALAQAIVQARRARPFQNVQDLALVRGIGPATVQRIQASGLICPQG